MIKVFLLFLSLLVSQQALGAELDGSLLPLYWGIPFAGLLLSIALFPLFAPHFWHRHFGKVALTWALLLLVPLMLTFGVDISVASVFHAITLEYIPFILLLLALYVVSGGIVLNNCLSGKPVSNTALLAFGTLIASLMGTTGAGMLLIRPLLQAISHRRYRVHSIIFFIFLVANIGGSLSPLGDPPLFLGFLNGVSFLWPLKALWIPTLELSVILLAIYILLDTYLYKKEGQPTPANPCEPTIQLIGKHNLLFLAAVVGLVLLSGIWKPGISWTILGTELTLQNIVRDLGMLGVVLASLKLTPKENYLKNNFSWFPITEVAKLFIAIFITIIPVIAILQAGHNGALSSLIALVTDNTTGEPHNAAYFWLTGGLSSFLDNAPTYLVFFNMAGGDAAVLMTSLSKTLMAISMGAVYMGAMTYIGNAPNFMVRSIAVEKGIKMPSFFGYMLWSVGILVPIFLLLTWELF